jgi:hypothetical protein
LTNLLDSTGIVSSSVIPIVVNQGAVNLNVNTSGTSLVTVNSVTFNLTRSANIWTFAIGSIQRTDANVGTFSCIYGMQMDGSYPSAFGATPTLWGDTQAVLCAAALNNGVLTVPVTFQTVWLGVPSGAHTLAVVCQSSGANGVFNVSGNPALLSLGN